MSGPAHGNMKLGLAASISLNATPAEVDFQKHGSNETVCPSTAEVFHTVSGDFAFYQFPSTSVWDRLFAQVPAGFRFAFKAPEEITTPAFPRHPRYGSRAGQPNPLFLDPKALT